MGQAAQYIYIGDSGVIGLFFTKLEPALGLSWVPTVATNFRSTMDVERYAGIGTAPAMREWVGGRLVKTLTEQKLDVENKDYESTMRIDLKDLRRDKTGMLEISIAQFAERAAEINEKLLSAIINAADTTTYGTTFDGKAFFAADHSVGDSGTMDNDIEVTIATLPVPTTSHGSTTAPAPEELALAILQGVQTMRGFKDDQGEPVNTNIGEITVMVPVSYASAAEQAITMSTFGGGYTNPLYGAASFRKRLVVNPRLDWTTEFAVFRTDSAQKPFLTQTEQDIVLEVLGEGSDYEFLNNARLYGAKRSGGLAYWDFTKGVRVSLA